MTLDLVYEQRRCLECGLGGMTMNGVNSGRSRISERLRESGVLVASGNKKKLAELKRILGEFGIRIMDPSDAEYNPEVEETEDTFEGNAELKARAGVEKTGLPTIADDSGLVVDALGGEPGVYSARYGGEGLDDDDRNNLVLEKMRGVEDEKRSARFVSVVCLAIPGGEVYHFRGTVEGRIMHAVSGEGGFGYDPLFLDTASGVSFASLDPADKDAISHRGNALRLLRDFLSTH